MNTNKKRKGILKEVKINVKMKLAGLWISAMFCWIYGDLLRIYSGDYLVGGDIRGDLIAPEKLWLVSAITMIVPGAMVFLSLALKAKTNRTVNIVLGIFYTCYSLTAFFGGGYPSAYDNFLLLVGILFTALVVWYAWRWPKQEN